jgi:hypothetical protein
MRYVFDNGYPILRKNPLQLRKIRLFKHYTAIPQELQLGESG